MSDAIEQRASFDFIRYANCWEDADILCEALQPAPGKCILSIASGGDNAFALLAGGADVIAADINPAQLACIELKCAAMRQLAYDDLLGFLGIRMSQDRPATYRRLRRELSANAQAFWDHHERDLAAGFVHAGKFEQYFNMFRTRILPLIHSKARISELLREKPERERAFFYDNRWDTIRWRMLFKIFFSRIIMGRLGRDPEFFRYVEGSVADRILVRAKYALTALPTHSNPYLEYILRGNFGHALPLYLQPGTYMRVRKGLERLTLHRGTVQDAAKKYATGGFDGYNLSDIFEYLDADTCASVYGELFDHANPGARFAYWNMLVPRSRPNAWADRMESLNALANELFDKDKAFFYSAFVVEEVKV